jgi:hypothetical protein
MSCAALAPLKARRQLCKWLAVPVTLPSVAIDV